MPPYARFITSEFLCVKLQKTTALNNHVYAYIMKSRKDSCPWAFFHAENKTTQASQNSRNHAGRVKCMAYRYQVVCILYLQRSCKAPQRSYFY